MKIDRLIGILSILLQREKVTAPYLAEKFEVSRRTIHRDIEAICKAGIPIVTTQGTNGGITIMEGYRMNRTLLTSSDMQAILAGLRSLDSVSGTKRYQQLMEKFSAGNSSVRTQEQHIFINLSSWYGKTLSSKIELLQEAIEARTLVEFLYYAPKKESKRKIEPYLLVFQWSSWYIWGYCLEKQDYRLFKLNRIIDLRRLEETYEIRELPVFQAMDHSYCSFSLKVKILFEPEMKWYLIDEYGIDSFQEQKNGKLLFEYCFSNKYHLFSWLLGCGKKVELIEPVELRKELVDFVTEIGQKYQEK